MSDAFRNTPFKLDLSQRNTLSEQMENALRQAIVSGRYRPGESLPPIRAWAKMLGVSIRVPEAVVSRLAREGLIIARPRHGCIVAPRGKTIFKGHVLLVLPPGDHVYVANIMCNRITRRLESAGYLVSRTTLPAERRDRPDPARLNLALRQSVDLAVLVYEHPAIARAARALGVPFVWFGDNPPRDAACSFRFSNDAAFRRFARVCADARVRRLEVVCKSYDPARATLPDDAFAGLSLRTMAVPIDEKALRPGSIATGAMRAFCRRLARPDAALPDLFFFTDDYLFQGALPVLLKHGVRIPERLKLVTVSNAGNGPVAPDPFDRIEHDPLRHGDTVAAVLLDCLRNRRVPAAVTLDSEYVCGG